MSDAPSYVSEKTHLESLKGNLKYIGIAIGIIGLIIGIVIIKKKGK